MAIPPNHPINHKVGEEEEEVEGEVEGEDIEVGEAQGMTLDKEEDGEHLGGPLQRGKHQWGLQQPLWQPLPPLYPQEGGNSR